MLEQRCQFQRRGEGLVLDVQPPLPNAQVRGDHTHQARLKGVRKARARDEEGSAEPQQPNSGDRPLPRPARDGETVALEEDFSPGQCVEPSDRALLAGSEERILLHPEQPGRESPSDLLLLWRHPERPVHHECLWFGHGAVEY